MCEMVVIYEQRFVIVHVVCGTIVLNPNSFDSLDPPIKCCFETECKSTENCIIGKGGAIVDICEICCISSAIFSASLPSTATVARLLYILGFLSLLCKV